MTPDRWQQLELLFQAALERPANERLTYLTQACAGDAALLQEAEKLLASFDSASDFLETPAADSLGLAGRAAVAPGQRIAHYEILSALGAGGMGEVYLARDLKLERQIALKLLPAHFSRDAVWVERFNHEARAASALNHPNILTIHEIGEDADTHFIAAEYVAGQTLRQKLNAGRLPLREALHIATQIAAALSAAHQAGIIHRDIKPENVMIRPDGLVKVLDFGLAKPVGVRSAEGGGRSTTESDAQQEPNTLHSALRTPPSALPTPHSQTDPALLLGTLAYLSPEQARREELDARTDIFSLGVVLHEMLTGRRPAVNENDAAAQPLPPELLKLLRRALAQDRRERFQQTDELSTALQDWLRKHEPEVQASRSSWLLKTAAVAALFVIAWGVWRWTERGKQSSRSAATTSPWTEALAERITGYQGEEFTPIFSPDEQSLVFMHAVDGDNDLCWQRLGDTSFNNLTAHCTANDMQPAFSPDGAQLAFRSECEGGGIFLMTLKDGQAAEQRRVADAGYNPTWSPDGKTLLYSTGNASNPHIRRTASGQLWTLQLDTGEKRHLTTPDAMQPRYSPHGWRIAYWGVNPAQPKQRDLWTIPAQGGEPVTVTNDAALDWNPLWSPDGQYLYFVSNQTGIMNLWRVRLDERTGKVLAPPETVTGPSAETWQPNFSRDGKRMIYVQRNVRSLLETMAFDTQQSVVTGTPSAVTQGTQSTGFPDLSPDGEWLAYYNFGAKQEDIFLIKRDGSQLQQLTNDECKDRMPRWSPDGEQLAFYSDCSGADQIWLVNRNTHARRQLTFQSGAGAQYPVWSPDGARLAFHSRGLGTFTMEVKKIWQEQTPQPIAPFTTAGQAFIAWSWSADGQRLAGVRGNADEDFPGIWVYEIATKQYRQLTNLGAYPIWLPDSRRVIFSDERRLHLADAQTTQTRVLLNPASYTVNYGLPARDGQRIYFTSRAGESDIWLLTLK